MKRQTIIALKAGYKSGFYFGILNAFVTVAIYSLMLIPLGFSPPVENVYLYTIGLAIPIKILWGVLAGATFGILFTYLDSKLTPTKPSYNLIIIVPIYWLIMFILIGMPIRKYYLSLYGISVVVDSFIGLVLLFIWGLIFLKVYNNQSRKAKEDIPSINA
jgi:hypothetical protein